MPRSRTLSRWLKITRLGACRATRPRLARLLHDLAAPAHGLMDLVAPRHCAACGHMQQVGACGPLCGGCSSTLPWLARGGRCELCQGEVAEPRPGDGPRLRCAACLAHEATLDACVAAVSYEGEAERWIHRFKYPAAGLAGLEPSPAAVICSLSLDAARRAPPPAADLIVPIPLHPRRLEQRGFNPAAVLARAIGHEMKIAVSFDLLHRTRNTRSQTGLDRRGRLSNIAGAFECSPSRHALGRVWLVDDVVTTTATLSEAARRLRAAGAGEIVGVCVARTALRAELGQH